MLFCICISHPHHYSRSFIKELTFETPLLCVLSVNDKN